MRDHTVSYHAFGAATLSALRQALHGAAEVAEGSVLLLVLTVVTDHFDVAVLLFDLDMACPDILHA